MRCGMTNISLDAQLDLLWENSSPTSNFSALAITIQVPYLSLDTHIDYNSIMIEYKYNASTTMGGHMDYLILPIGQAGTGMIKNFTNTTFTGRVGYSAWNYNSLTTLWEIKVTFLTGYSGSSTGTGYCVPCRIYGIRNLPALPIS